MPRHRAIYRIDRSPERTFDVIGTHVYENHPRWEAEVLEIRPLTPGPVRLGSRAVMVREERGRRSEAPYEVTAFEPGREIAFRHLDGPMGFTLRFTLAPAGDSATDLTVDVDMAPRGVLRLISPLIALQLPGRTDRITRQMVALVEGRAATAPTVSGPAEAVAEG